MATRSSRRSVCPFCCAPTFVRRSVDGPCEVVCNTKFQTTEHIENVVEYQCSNKHLFYLPRAK